ncbi:hypothetical protein [Actinokineospora terrae]|uniref:DUF3558 domain-containing protein n=1 Tax=Actinokineospora terrae TaxID=155974 RepID=A0A1H9M990_9PSEU|nr:hypothetical protein [Actinokineospora terrae]SER20141.1 hypothetical protein SAMN04487818_10231 [Actinokineospora terrae]
MAPRTTLAAIISGTLILTATTACTDTSTADRVGGPVGSGVTGPPHTSPGRQVRDQDGARDGVEQRRGGRAPGAIVLGDLDRPRDARQVGAPFDPCSVTWQDFPPAVRPTDGKPHPPALRSPGKDDPFDVRCAFDGVGTIRIPTDGAAGGPVGGYFLTSVVWGTRLNADPAARAGSVAKTWSGKPGLQARVDDAKSGPGCVGLARLAHGVAGVSVTNGLFPGVDPCAVVDSVLTAITARTP